MWNSENRHLDLYIIDKRRSEILEEIKFQRFRHDKGWSPFKNDNISSMFLWIKHDLTLFPCLTFFLKWPNILNDAMERIIRKNRLFPKFREYRQNLERDAEKPFCDRLLWSWNCKEKDRGNERE